MGKNLDITDAERKRRSELATQLNKKVDPITGRPVFGGRQPGAGRPRKKRATEMLNEKIEAHTEDIWDRLYLEMKHGKSMPALMAIKQMIEITNTETEIQSKEELALDNTSTEELVELVASRLARLAESGVVPYADVDITDADVVEPGEISEGIAEEDGSQGSSSAGQANSRFGDSAFARRSSN